jgi:hypothetical protein
MVSARSRLPRNIFAADARMRQQGMRVFVPATQHRVQCLRVFQNSRCAGVRGAEMRCVMVRIVPA